MASERTERFKDGERVQCHHAPVPSVVVKTIPEGHDIVLWEGRYQLVSHEHLREWTPWHESFYQSYLQELEARRG